MDNSGVSAESRTGSVSRLRRLAVAAVFVLLVSSVVVRMTGAVDPLLAGAALALLIVLGVVVVLSTAGSSTETNGDDEDGNTDDGESDVWDAIPSWQYEGRHVESGGLARGEQEQALQDIQRQADELSEEPEK
ncbi:hypothetical protein [Natronorubrum texcoconense]|uniref:Uncharacterized protein n=1 Tax=Natronorubrum texcoconense TaxID=1095776 RepID=A0A1G9B751_9EURY|nr:hypothetical protein [Natronorubrum texcoconense]SDK35386.1 hypothetical protein SAMN04515672_2851 [Natronorubrum texcoconense]